MKEVKAFECQHCKGLFKKPKSCQKHEDRCWKNPDYQSSDDLPF